jgi:fermentation-respiration switch protein FrsA (DUF1100 family)
MRRTVILGIFFFAGLVAARTARAVPQSKGTGGTLTGVVTGPDDKPVPDAVITYQSGGGSAKGHFAIPKLRSDSYELRASGKGVFSEWEKNVFVKSGETKFVRLRLIYAKEVPKEYKATETYQVNPH